MKSLFIILALMIGISIPVISYADTAPSASVNQTITPEDAAKMREQIVALSKALGNPEPTKPAASATPAPSASATPTTAAEVASKAIDMMGSGANKVVDMIGNAVGTLSANLAKIAPEVWRIMIMQQYAKAANVIVVPILLLILTGAVTIVLRKNFPPPPPWEKDWDQGDCFRLWVRTIIPTIFMCWFGCWFVSGVSDGIRYLINPEFYAIKDILMLITDPSSVGTQ
jgi:hypothetical protein